jgi:hypothetical protein
MKKTFNTISLCATSTITAFFFVLASTGAYAQETRVSEKPSAEQAAQAIAEMFGQPASVKTIQARLGTCVPAVKASQKGQIACTVAIIIGAGSSETQVDFYRDPEKPRRWIAEPSESQDRLPFPDPKLR